MYCREACSQTAQLVRYVRRCRADGRDQQPDVAEAIQVKMALVLGGGYPAAARTVPPQVRAAVYARSGGKCEHCGVDLLFDYSRGDPGPCGATIQHTNSSSNELDDLAAWCRQCNTGDAKAKFVPATGASLDLARQIEARWMSEHPLQFCDDERNWAGQWRKLAAGAERRFPEAAE